jgi:hypothetical protein
MKQPISMERTLFLVWIILILSSCNSQEFSTSRSIQKRKYRPGFHINGIRQKNLRENEHRFVSLNRFKKDDPYTIDPLVKDTVGTNIELGQAFPKFQSNHIFKERIANLTEPGLSVRENDSHPLAKLETYQEIEPELSENSSMKYAGLVALLCGIMAILGIMFIPFLGVAFSILTLVFSIKAIHSRHQTSKTLGIVGMVLSFIALLVSILITLIVTMAIGLFGS